MGVVICDCAVADSVFKIFKKGVSGFVTAAERVSTDEDESDLVQPGQITRL